MKLIIKLSDLANSHEEEPFRLLSHETCSVADFHGSPESIGFVFSHAFSQGIRWSSSIRQKYGHWRRFVGKLPAKKLLTFPWTFQGSKAKLSKLSAPLTLIKFCAYPLLLLSRRFSSSTYSLYWRTFYGDQSHISCRNDANLMTLSNLHKSITAFHCDTFSPFAASLQKPRGLNTPRLWPWISGTPNDKLDISKSPLNSLNSEVFDSVNQSSISYNLLYYNKEWN